MLILSSALLSAGHPVTLSPSPPFLLQPFGHFPELGASHGLSPSLIFPLSSPPFPYNPFHYFLYSPYEWNHIMFVLLQLTYFTQHNGGCSSFLMAEQYSIVYIDHIFFIQSSFEAPSTVWLLWTLLLETWGWQIPTICFDVDGTGGYYAEWNKSIRE